MALGHVFVSCVDILLNNIFSVSYYLFADGCFHYKLYYYLSDDVNLLTYQLFLQITIHGINSRWTPNCICTIIGWWHGFNCIYYKVFIRIFYMCALCSRNFQNVKLRLTLLKFDDLTATPILSEITFWWIQTVQKCHL